MRFERRTSCQRHLASAYRWFRVRIRSHRRPLRSIEAVKLSSITSKAYRKMLSSWWR
jgi:hypothetical protein